MNENNELLLLEYVVTVNRLTLAVNAAVCEKLLYGTEVADNSCVRAEVANVKSLLQRLRLTGAVDAAMLDECEAALYKLVAGDRGDGKTRTPTATETTQGLDDKANSYSEYMSAEEYRKRTVAWAEGFNFDTMADTTTTADEPKPGMGRFRVSNTLLSNSFDSVIDSIREQINIISMEPAGSEPFASPGMIFVGLSHLFDDTDGVKTYDLMCSVDERGKMRVDGAKVLTESEDVSEYVQKLLSKP